MKIRTLLISALLASTPVFAQGEHDAHGAAPADETEATRAYVGAMDKMHDPMMQAAQDPDPDVAFVKGMIPHHQAAIDMAKIVQQFGDDDETKALAARIIEAQEAEIAEMEEWLKKNAK
jgi:uncharacterized protein (DUF305 family)